MFSQIKTLVLALIPCLFVFSLTSSLITGVTGRVLAPAWQEIRRMKKEYTEMRSILSGRPADSPVARGIDSRTVLLSNHLNDLRAGFAPFGKMSDAINGIYSLAWRVGKDKIVFIKTDPGIEYIEGGNMYIPITLEIESDYVNLRCFISAIEHTPGAFHIDGVSIEPLGANKLNTLLAVSAYLNGKGTGR